MPLFIPPATVIPYSTYNQFGSGTQQTGIGNSIIIVGAGGIGSTNNLSAGNITVSNGTFTTPTAGIYQINYSLVISAASTTGFIGFAWVWGNSTSGTILGAETVFTITATTSFYTLSSRCLVSQSAGQTCGVAVESGTAGDTFTVSDACVLVVRVA